MPPPGQRPGGMLRRGRLSARVVGRRNDEKRTLPRLWPWGSSWELQRQCGDTPFAPGMSQAMCSNARVSGTVPLS